MWRDMCKEKMDAQWPAMLVHAACHLGEKYIPFLLYPGEDKMHIFPKLSVIIVTMHVKPVSAIPVLLVLCIPQYSTEKLNTMPSMDKSNLGNVLNIEEYFLSNNFQLNKVNFSKVSN